MEMQYCQVQQAANLRAMAPDDILHRLEWQKQEIIRINTEKEAAIQANEDRKKERDLLQKDLDSLMEVKMENQTLKQLNNTLRKKKLGAEKELEETRTRLELAQFALSSIPGPLQKLCGKVLVAEARSRKNRYHSRSGLLIPDLSSTK